MQAVVLCCRVVAGSLVRNRGIVSRACCRWEAARGGLRLVARSFVAVVDARGRLARSGNRHGSWIKKKFPHGFPTVSPPRNALYVSEIDRYGQVLLLVHRYLAQIHLVAPGGLLNEAATAALTGIRAVQGSPKTLWALPDLPTPGEVCFALAQSERPPDATKWI